MWNTPEGDRKLEGAERRAFMDGLLEEIQSIRDWEDIEEVFEAPILNHISQEDRPYVFLRVAEDLLGDGPAPVPMAWSEAVIWEIYEQLKAQVELSIELAEDAEKNDRHPFYYRRIVLDAFKEVLADEEFELPKLQDDDAEEWAMNIGFLADEILHDEDFLNYDDFADAAPGPAAAAKDILRIDPEYYAAVPPMFTVGDKKRLDLFYKALRKESDAWYPHFLKTGKIL